MKLLRLLKQIIKEELSLDKKSEEEFDEDDMRWLNSIKKSYDNAKDDYEKRSWQQQYDRMVVSIKKEREKKREEEKYKEGIKKSGAEVVGSSKHYDSSNPVDQKIIPKSIKDWIKEKNYGKIGKIYVSDYRGKLYFNTNLNSSVNEKSQFFELKKDKKGNLMPQPVGGMSDRWGKDPDFSAKQYDIQGVFSVPSNKILVVSEFLSLGRKYVTTIIYTGQDFFDKIDNGNSIENE